MATTCPDIQWQIHLIVKKGGGEVKKKSVFITIQIFINNTKQIDQVYNGISRFFSFVFIMFFPLFHYMFSLTLK